MADQPITQVTHVTRYVADADEALEWYTDVLGFETRADETFGEGNRWLTVAPPGQAAPEVVLMEGDPHDPDDPEDTPDRGGGTMWVVRTDDCRAAFETLAARGVAFDREPEEVPWGVSAIFRDPDGNPYNLVEPA